MCKNRSNEYKTIAQRTDSAQTDAVVNGRIGYSFAESINILLDLLSVHEPICLSRFRKAFVRLTFALTYNCIDAYKIISIQSKSFEFNVICFEQVDEATS